MNKTRRLIFVAIALVVFVLVGSAVYRMTPFGLRQARVRLLTKTDFEALVKAGREVISQVHIPPDPHGARRIGSFPVPAGVQIPAAIRRLHPRGFAMTYDGYLFIQMHGAIDNFGVRIYPADFEPPDQYFKHGDRQLIDGLWYYDDNLGRGTEYDKWIDTLIAKNKTRQNQNDEE
ncbi:MAG: hypothetical protein JW741_27555 [Sedimentisphaerales bacterium]|nr:hypothetical protein [Sedimentisphaerales bacterium]